MARMVLLSLSLSLSLSRARARAREARWIARGSFYSAKKQKSDPAGLQGRGDGGWGGGKEEESIQTYYEESGRKPFGGIHLSSRRWEGRLFASPPRQNWAHSPKGEIARPILRARVARFPRIRGTNSRDNPLPAFPRELFALAFPCHGRIPIARPSFSIVLSRFFIIFFLSLYLCSLFLSQHALSKPHGRFRYAEIRVPDPLECVGKSSIC
jgi:hypothetical protein